MKAPCASERCYRNQGHITVLWCLRTNQRRLQQAPRLIKSRAGYNGEEKEKNKEVEREGERDRDEFSLEESGNCQPPYIATYAMVLQVGSSCIYFGLALLMEIQSWDLCPGKDMPKTEKVQNCCWQSPRQRSCLGENSRLLKVGFREKRIPFTSLSDLKTLWPGLLVVEIQLCTPEHWVLKWCLEQETNYSLCATDLLWRGRWTW